MVSALVYVDFAAVVWALRPACKVNSNTVDTFRQRVWITLTLSVVGVRVVAVLALTLPCALVFPDEVSLLVALLTLRRLWSTGVARGMALHAQTIPGLTRRLCGLTLRIPDKRLLTLLAEACIGQDVSLTVTVDDINLLTVGVLGLSLSVHDVLRRLTFTDHVVVVG